MPTTVLKCSHPTPCRLLGRRLSCDIRTDVWHSRYSKTRAMPSPIATIYAITFSQMVRSHDYIGRHCFAGVSRAMTIPAINIFQLCQDHHYFCRWVGARLFLADLSGQYGRPVPAWIASAAAAKVVLPLKRGHENCAPIFGDFRGMSTANAEG